MPRPQEVPGVGRLCGRLTWGLGAEGQGVAGHDIEPCIVHTLKLFKVSIFKSDIQQRQAHCNHH